MSSSDSPASLSTLPNDLVKEVLGRVPNYHCRQVVSLVSKKFHDIVRCPLINQIRRRVGKVALYLSFIDTSVQEFPRVWYLLRSRVDDPTMNKFVSIQFPDIRNVHSIITVGPKVFFICGTRHTATRLFDYDSRSGELRESPVMLVEMRYHSSGLVSGKIYVIGTRLHDPDKEVLAESYDLDTETWEQAPIYEPLAGMNPYCSSASASIDDKVYALHFTRRGRNLNCYYDTRAGSCELFESCSYDQLRKTCICVIDNVLYLYDSKLGLMWYDSTLTQWGEVSGLDLNIVQQSVEAAEYAENKSVGMAEYHGKLAFVWIKPGGGTMNEIWGTRIALARSETGFDGTAEPFQLLGTVPPRYVLHHFFSVLG